MFQIIRLLKSIQRLVGIQLTFKPEPVTLCSQSSCCRGVTEGCTPFLPEQGECCSSRSYTYPKHGILNLMHKNTVRGQKDLAESPDLIFGDWNVRLMLHLDTRYRTDSCTWHEYIRRCRFHKAYVVLSLASALL